MLTHLDILRMYAYMAVMWYKADTDLSFDEWLALDETEKKL